ERQQREERKSAYVAYVRASIRFRNAKAEERHEIREERWAAFSEIVLVAPPAVVEAASYHITAGDRLLEPGLSPHDVQSVLVDIWAPQRAFTRLARMDIRVGAADPFEHMEPVLGEHIAFQP